MPNDAGKWARLCRTQAALTAEPNAKDILLKLAVQYENIEAVEYDPDDAALQDEVANRLMGRRSVEGGWRTIGRGKPLVSGDADRFRARAAECRRLVNDARRDEGSRLLLSNMADELEDEAVKIDAEQTDVPVIKPRMQGPGGA